MNLKAKKVYADYDQNDLLIIGFSGEIGGENISLMIQDAYDREDEQEIELGMDTFYVELNEQSRGGYGGISELEIWRNWISIKLNDVGKENLKIGVDEINIEIDVSENIFLDLKDKFKLIFEPEKKIKTAYNNGYK